MCMRTQTSAKGAIRNPITAVMAMAFLLVAGSAWAATYPILHNSSTANSKNYWVASGG